MHLARFPRRYSMLHFELESAVNNSIMGRNFVHVQDGTGDASSNNLVVTSNQTASVGDTVTISGVVVVNRDFGSGYAYPLLIEEASITVAK